MYRHNQGVDKTLPKRDSNIHKQEGEWGKKIGLHKNLKLSGNSLEIQWLGFRASTTEGSGLIPGWGTKIPQAVAASPKNKTKQNKQLLHGRNTMNKAKRHVTHDYKKLFY